jgi:hypothetical protein
MAMTTIGKYLIREAQESGGPARYEHNGLHYAMQIRPEAFVLSLIRRDRYPNAKEERSARAALLVPADAGPAPLLPIRLLHHPLRLAQR